MYTVENFSSIKQDKQLFWQQTNYIHIFPNILTDVSMDVRYRDSFINAKNLKGKVEFTFLKSTNPLDLG